MLFWKIMGWVLRSRNVKNWLATPKINRKFRFKETINLGPFFFFRIESVDPVDFPPEFSLVVRFLPGKGNSCDESVIDFPLVEIGVETLSWSAASWLITDRVFTKRKREKNTIRVLPRVKKIPNSQLTASIRLFN